MKIGELVEYKIAPTIPLVGVITKVLGRNWVKVTWPHGIIYDEYIYDLRILSES